MKTARRPRSARSVLSSDRGALLIRLAEAEETLRAIRSGEVDAVVTAGKAGPQVFTLEGADHAYRLLIESMNEGALTLTSDMTILYANQRFARMVKCPLERIMGRPFCRFLSTKDRGALRPLMNRASPSGSTIQVLLTAGDDSQIPVQISLRQLARTGGNRATSSMVVTDMTEARRNEELLRNLTHRVVQAQEAERGRVALELHDHITQLLCAILVRSQALANQLSARDGRAKREAIELRELLGQTAEEVERISQNLRPGVLTELGLIVVLRDTMTAFAKRTGVFVKLASGQLTARLPADTELALYRIVQEALRNVEQHARARHVTVTLKLQGAFAKLTIKDDGVGFCQNEPARRRKNRDVLGLLAMRERAAYVGGDLTVKSGRDSGTEIEARVPRRPGAKAAN